MLLLAVVGCVIRDGINKAYNKGGIGMYCSLTSILGKRNSALEAGGVYSIEALYYIISGTVLM